MIYVYRRALSTGAKDLANAIGGRRFRGRVRPINEVVKPGDSVVCWGEAVEPIPGVKFLNGAPIRNKYQDALLLKEKGVPTIEVAPRKPQAVAQAPVPVPDNVLKPIWEETIEAAEDFIELPYGRDNPAFIAGIAEFEALVIKLKAKLGERIAPAPVVIGEWIGRLKDHVGGADLLNPPAQVDYWAKKEKIVEEIRIHSFRGKSIRAGIKKPREGAQPHAWIRSYDGGWSIIYDGFESKKAQRDLAHAAVQALGLDFGAVDLAKRANGTWFVLEVNRAPGLEGGTIETYGTAIKNWMAQA